MIKINLFSSVLAAMFVSSALYAQNVEVIPMERGFTGIYERSVNRLGMVTISQNDVPIGRLAHMLLPEDWVLSYASDDMREKVVSWTDNFGGKKQRWHDALRQIGVREQMVFLVDGASKNVYATYPGHGRNPGVEIINSTSIVFQEDLVTQEIIRRAKSNEMNFKRRQIQEDLGRMESQKTELANQLRLLNQERENVTQQMARLSKSTAEAVSVVDSAKKDDQVLASAKAVEQKRNNVIVPAQSADFIFMVKPGLIINENARRFAKDLGYEVFAVDKRVPTNCDWMQDMEYTISATDPKKAFAEFVAPYGFKPNFTSSIAELIYIGPADSFGECAR